MTRGKVIYASFEGCGRVLKYQCAREGGSSILQCPKGTRVCKFHLGELCPEEGDQGHDLPLMRESDDVYLRVQLVEALECLKAALLCFALGRMWRMMNVFLKKDVERNASNL